MLNFPILQRLQPLLLIDAATCSAMGLLLIGLANPLAEMMAIPKPLLFWAGVALLPIAAFMIAVSRTVIVPAWALTAVVGGNVVWVLASILLPVLGLITPNALGYVFLMAQAAVVALLAMLEWRAARSVVVAA
jgi:hypothetical protein